MGFLLSLIWCIKITKYKTLSQAFHRENKARARKEIAYIAWDAFTSVFLIPKNSKNESGLVSLNFHILVSTEKYSIENASYCTLNRTELAFDQER